MAYPSDMTHQPASENAATQSSSRGSARKSIAKDWHAQDVVATLRKKGWSLMRLSVFHGYSPRTLNAALHRGYPPGECLIAAALELNISTIWPERIAARHARKNRRARTR
jgi:Ner family transcriptional regulator